MNLAAPLQSFYSGDLYRDVARRWRARSFLYLFLLVAACWVPTAIVIHIGCGRWVDTSGEAVAAQVPGIVIDHGVVTVDAEQPVLIRNPGSEATLAIIDTTGRTTSLSGSDALVFLGKEELQIRKGTAETRVYRLSGVDHLAIDAEVARRWLRVVRALAAPVVYVACVAGSFAVRIVFALLLAALGVWFSRSARAGLEYGALLSLAIVAMTPALLVKTLLESLHAMFPLSRLLLLAMTIAYLRFGVKACAAAAGPAAHPGAPPPPPPLHPV